jgi:multidrug resistance efflux pump
LSRSQRLSIVAVSVFIAVAWVRMAQRFPVRVTLLEPDPQRPLRKGMRATVRIDTTGEPTSSDPAR